MAVLTPDELAGRRDDWKQITIEPVWPRQPNTAPQAQVASLLRSLRWPELVFHYEYGLGRYRLWFPETTFNETRWGKLVARLTPMHWRVAAADAVAAVRGKGLWPTDGLYIAAYVTTLDRFNQFWSTVDEYVMNMLGYSVFDTTREDFWDVFLAYDTGDVATSHLDAKHYLANVYAPGELAVEQMRKDMLGED